MKEKVKAFGGTLAHSVRSKETICVIATKDAMEKKPSKLIEAAEKKQIQVCTEFQFPVPKSTSGARDFLLNHKV